MVLPQYHNSKKTYEKFEDRLKTSISSQDRIIKADKKKRERSRGRREKEKDKERDREKKSLCFSILVFNYRMSNLVLNMKRSILRKQSYQ